MEKRKLKKPYDNVAIDILRIQQSDVITTSGTVEGTGNPGFGGSGEDNWSWT